MGIIKTRKPKNKKEKTEDNLASDIGVVIALVFLLGGLVYTFLLSYGSPLYKFGTATIDKSVYQGQRHGGGKVHGTIYDYMVYMELDDENGTSCYAHYTVNNKDKAYDSSDVVKIKYAKNIKDGDEVYIYRWNYWTFLAIIILTLFGCIFSVKALIKSINEYKGLKKLKNIRKKKI